MKLYEYFRSSAAYRVRIALRLKNVEYAQIPVNLLQGEQRDREYAAINPQQLVPTLVLDDGATLTQSLAICEYLDEVYPEPRLLPDDPLERARVRSLACVVACDIHPIANLRVQHYVRDTLAGGETATAEWIRHWISQGFAAYEALLHASGGSFSWGERVTLADVFLVPQYYNAQRFGADTEPYPKLSAVAERCAQLPAFAAAHPDNQPDSPQR